MKRNEEVEVANSDDVDARAKKNKKSTIMDKYLLCLRYSEIPDDTFFPFFYNEQVDIRDRKRKAGEDASTDTDDDYKEYEYRNLELWKTQTFARRKRAERQQRRKRNASQRLNAARASRAAVAPENEHPAPEEEVP